jgi:hypothetical protein
MCLESMFNGLRKVGNECGNDYGVRRSHGFSYTPLRGLRTCTAYARWSEP